MSSKPNIIFILADDMGYGDLSCYGAEKFRTPAMDAVAEKGIRFTDMHSSSAVCTPSRYSVLTGRYCWRTRLKDFVLGGFGSPLIEPGRPTIASYLKSKGYDTKALGKWHLGLKWFDTNGRPLEESDQDGWNVDGDNVDYPRGFEGGPCELGFDEFLGIAGSLDMPPYCFLKNNGPESLPDRDKDFYYPQQRQGKMSRDWDDKKVDLRFTNEAVAYIDEHSGSDERNPFFLYLAPSSPHRPCLPPDFLEGKSNAGFRGDMVLMVDYMVGKVSEALERNGLTENTLLVVSSDNGARSVNFDGKDYGHKPNGDFRGQKGDIHEGGHREPCVAMWPAVIQAGTESGELLSLVDLFATCTDILGDDLPAGAGEDSRSFLPVLRGAETQTSVHEAVVHHSLDGMFSLRKGPWKAIFGAGSGGFSEPVRYKPEAGQAQGQLYNIEDDTRETNNLWDRRPEIVAEFREILQRYQTSGRSC